MRKISIVFPLYNEEARLNILFRGLKKQELDVRILAQAKVVVDLIDQCKNVGELHHGIKAGVISEEEVHAELGQVIIGTRTGRTSDEEVIVFDATGSALQDTAGAIAVYERAVSSKHSNNFNFFS